MIECVENTERISGQETFKVFLTRKSQCLSRWDTNAIFASKIKMHEFFLFNLQFVLLSIEKIAKEDLSQSKDEMKYTINNKKKLDKMKLIKQISE